MRRKGGGKNPETEREIPEPIMKRRAGIYIPALLFMASPSHRKIPIPTNRATTPKSAHCRNRR